MPSIPKAHHSHLVEIEPLWLNRPGVVVALPIVVVVVVVEPAVHWKPNIRLNWAVEGSLTAKEILLLEQFPVFAVIGMGTNSVQQIAAVAVEIVVETTSACQPVLLRPVFGLDLLRSNDAWPVACLHPTPLKPMKDGPIIITCISKFKQIMRYPSLTVHRHATFDATIKSTLLTTISILLVTNRTISIELAGILQLLLHRATEEALTAFASHCTIVIARGVVTANNTWFRSV